MQGELVASYIGVAAILSEGVTTTTETDWKSLTLAMEPRLEASEAPLEMPWRIGKTRRSHLLFLIV